MSINAWGSDDPAEVAKGGTGNATLTDHGVLLGSGTSPVTVTAAPTDGQLLIGSTGVDPAIATPTGDTNEIALTLGAGSLAIGIADNPVIPGTADMTIPVGTTAQEPSAVDGMIRYDSDTDKLRGVENGVWYDIITSGGGGGSLVYLASSIITSSTATVEFDNTYINTYSSFVIHFHAVAVTASATLFRISNDNGSTFHSSGYSSNGRSGAISTYVGSTYTDSFRTQRNTEVSGTALRGIWGRALFQNVTSSSLYTSVDITCSFNGSGNVPSPGSGGGQYLTAEANDAIQMLFSVGNISTGEVHLYGVATS